MLFAGLPRKSNNCGVKVLVLVLRLIAWPLAPTFAAADVSGRSFIYCRENDGAAVFAGQNEPDGNLKFGLSVWSPAGQNISVFGIATRRGDRWQYTDNLHASTASKRCRIDIERHVDGTLRISADPHAACQSRGGVNAEIGIIQFPPAAYEGTVTTELNDPEAFQRAGKCIDGKN